MKFLPSSASDFLVLAETEDGKAGLGRLVPIDAQCAELGGICVLPAWRGQGLARDIVSFLLQHSPYQRLYCVPFAHLSNFYCSFGFVPVRDMATVPCAIAEKFNWCTREYSSELTLLVRER
ncbi:MAG TPA: GNAT family N-acetyltransferase [Rhodocyclaceae bacterium]|nr:GNAT family N-acetyltransferase [Rhodocyclaceae bacterium]